jgi:hypothetical protein
MSHYDELGVAPDATAADLRQGYRARAARLHPDKHAGGSAEELAAAERDMRTLNEAWHVLSDPGRRRRYDESLLPPASVPPASHEPARGRVGQPLEEGGGGSALVRVLPVALLLLSLAAIFVFTAFAVGGPDSEASGPGTPASGAAGAAVGDCVIVRGGHVSQVVPCDEPNDGQITEEVDRDKACSRVEERPVDGQSGSTRLCLAEAPGT